MPSSTRSKSSAGLLVYRLGATGPELLLVHPGGPYFAKKDAGAWTIPKGELEPGEDLLACARREFLEELGQPPPPLDAGYLALGECRQRGGKVVHAWACQADLTLDASLGASTFEIEWPPRSGRRRSFPEIDVAEYFDVETARRKLNPAQHVLIDRWLASR